MTDLLADFRWTRGARSTAIDCPQCDARIDVYYRPDTGEYATELPDRLEHDAIVCPDGCDLRAAQFRLLDLVVRKVTPDARDLSDMRCVL